MTRATTTSTTKFTTLMTPTAAPFRMVSMPGSSFVCAQFWIASVRFCRLSDKRATSWGFFSICVTNQWFRRRTVSGSWLMMPMMLSIRSGMTR